jgi:hypothetical protein
MGSTKFTGTFMSDADDCPVGAAEQPPSGAKAPKVALQYSLMSVHP